MHQFNMMSGIKGRRVDPYSPEFQTCGPTGVGPANPPGDFSAIWRKWLFLIDVNSLDVIMQDNDDPAAVELQSTSVRSLSLFILMDIYPVMICFKIFWFDYVDVRLIFPRRPVTAAAPLPKMSNHTNICQKWKKSLAAGLDTMQHTQCSPTTGVWGG